jgi:hypothetical protein
MTTKDLLSHFNLTQLPFSKEIPVAQLLELPSLQRAYWSYPVFVDKFGLVVWVTPKFFNSYSIGES